MVEIWLFGRLIATLASALSAVLVLVTLTSITYLAMTLSPTLRLGDARGREADRVARRLGLSVAAVALTLAVIGLRVGAPGLGAEIVPTLALSVAAAATLGSTCAFAALGGGRALSALGDAGARRAAAIAGKREGDARLLRAARRAFLDGEDLRGEVADAEAAVARLAAALEGLARTRDEVTERLDRIDDAAAAGDLGRELRRTRDEVATKLDLGEKIHRAARVAALRMAAAAPLARLLRRRPHDVARHLPGADAAAVPAQLAEIAAALEAFLTDAADARAELDYLAARRPDDLGGEEDPIDQSRRDVEAVEAAYRAVRERLEVVRMRAAAQAQVDAVASAAGELREKARASGIPAADLQALVDEVMRAESAILMATPAELDGDRLVETLGRGTIALGGHDGASLDELLRALRDLA